MTNKLFIVKYVFVVDIDNDIDKNFNTNLNRRESFDDANFDAICTQNICFFDVANDVANKINSIKLVDEVKSV